jgi:hypothetical protein
MRSRTIALFAGVFMISSGIARAETLSFPEHNFSFELPEGWSKTDAPAPAVAAMKNTDAPESIRDHRGADAG